MNVHLNQHGFSVTDPERNSGLRNFGLRLALGGRNHLVQYGEVKETEPGRWTAAGEPFGSLGVQTEMTALPGGQAVVVTHQLRNAGAAPLRVLDVATGQFAADAAVLHGQGGWLGMDWRYCHTDNVRTECYPHCQMEYPYERMLPVHTVRLGEGQDQPFPALYMRDRRGGGGIVIGAASQAFNYAVFVLRKAALVKDGVFAQFEIAHEPGQSAGFTIPAGGAVCLDGLYIELVADREPGDAYTGYIEYIAAQQPFRGPGTALLREAFHCTWNYGVFADQTEASLLPTARFISAHVPNIKWFLMDAGYLAGDINTTFLDRFYPDPNQYVTKEKWPTGIRGFTDQLRALGLRPGLWWSPTVRVPSRLHDEHPDWYLRNADGSLYLIGGQNGFLDYSNPEALAYLDRTLAVILGEWGMDACKMDFWSQNFEDRQARLHDPGVTAVQARDRFLGTVRKHLPADGIFMTCVAVGMGNPFVGQWADTYRNTIDIGVGSWHEQVDNCFWSLPTLCIEGRKTFLLNNDSAGIMAAYPDNENRFRLTWSYINMGMIETGGRMETWPAQWVEAIRALTDRCDRGYRVHCPDERAFTGVPLPEVLYVDFPAESPTAQAGVRQSVALFNWSDEPRMISVPRQRLGQRGPVQAVDFWTGQPETLDGEFLSRRLDGRAALLLDIRQA